MRYDKEREGYVLSSGRFFCSRDYLSPFSKMPVIDGDEVQDFTDEERAEIAEYMISAWKAWDKRELAASTVDPPKRSLAYYDHRDIRHEDDCPKAGSRGCDVGEHYYVVHDAKCECGLDELLNDELKAWLDSHRNSHLSPKQ